MAERSGGLGTAFAGLALGAGVAVGAWFMGGALIQAQAPERLVTVKGLSERVMMADSANWRVPFRGLGDTQKEAIEAAVYARDMVVELGRDGGLAPEMMSVEPFSVTLERNYLRTATGEQEEMIRYTATGAVRMRSADTELIEALTQRTAELLDRGVLLGEGYSSIARPVYAFTGLNEIKPEMIAEATRNARAGADQFAEDSGSQVGRIVKANQGAVQIVAADGDYDERAERRKLVRLVSTVVYELVD